MAATNFVDDLNVFQARVQSLVRAHAKMDKSWTEVTDEAYTKVKSIMEDIRDARQVFFGNFTDQMTKMQKTLLEKRHVISPDKYAQVSASLAVMEWMAADMDDRVDKLEDEVVDAVEKMEQLGGFGTLMYQMANLHSVSGLERTGIKELRDKVMKSVDIRWLTKEGTYSDEWRERNALGYPMDEGYYDEDDTDEDDIGNAGAGQLSQSQAASMTL
jgi:hypothetical protein